MQNLAKLLRELIGGQLISVDEHPLLRHEAKDDLVLHRGRRKVRRCLGGNAHQITHLHDGRDDHEDDEQNEDDVDQRGDVDVRA